MQRALVVILLCAACSERASTPKATAVTPPATDAKLTTAKPNEDPAIANARGFVALLVAGKHAEAAAMFDTTMAAALPASKLEATWNGLVGQVGAFETVEGARIEHAGKFTTAILTCKFAKTRLDARVSYDDAGKIAGLHFAPASEAYSDPGYVDRSKLEEREVTVGSGEWALPGTLALPKGAGPFRAIVLVHGSGPNDRDESIGANKPFKDLALGLATQGIAVLRYDKRTKMYGMKMAAMPELTLEQETVEDALAAVELLHGMKEIDGAHIVVAGHSLGGFAAPRIGVKSPHIAGLAILAGSTSSDLAATMIAQMQYIASVDPSQASAMPAEIEKIKTAGARIKELQGGAKPTAGELVLGAPAAYWIDLGKYDPLVTVKQYKKPIFVEQGGRDYQVTQTDYAAWQKALAGRKNVMFKLYPELDHAFSPGTGKSSPHEYDVRTPVDARLVTDLAAWVKAL